MSNGIYRSPVTGRLVGWNRLKSLEVSKEDSRTTNDGRVFETFVYETGSERVTWTFTDTVACIGLREARCLRQPI